jgi:transcriptional regulator with XRE-family HTH domain
MNPTQPLPNLPHGVASKVADAAGVSRTTVSNVLNRKPGVSVPMINKVVKAAKKVMQAHQRQRDDADNALNQLAA